VGFGIAHNSREHLNFLPHLGEATPVHAVKFAVNLSSGLFNFFWRFCLNALQKLLKHTLSVLGRVLNLKFFL
jgi:hypothetical protein